MLFAAKEPALFIDLPSLGIVLVGTLAATFISYPLREVTRVFGLIWTVMRNERLYTRQDLDELVQISRLWISGDLPARSEEHTSELQSLMRNSYAVFCLKKQTHKILTHAR